MKKRKLLFTAVNLEVGGIETSLLNLLNNINYDKYEVDLILEEKKGVLLDKVNTKVNIKEIKVSQNKIVLIRKIINCCRKLFFYLFNHNKYDFSCCYATYSYSCNVLTRIASRNSTLYVHSNYRDLYHKEQEFKDFFDKRNIRLFKKIIFVSNESRTSFLEIYPDLQSKTEVLNNFIDIDLIQEKSHEQILIKKKKDKILFVFVGRLDDSSKKLGRAINLVDKIEEIELWIVGDGVDKKLYEHMVQEKNLQERVMFLGRQSNPYPYMMKADYIILTSDYEGFPVTYLEAIVLNKTIITTINVSDEAINIKKDFGYIISKDEDNMVDEVLDILKNKKVKKDIDLKRIQKERMIRLEKIFDEEK